MPIYPTTRPDSTIGILSVNESTAKARYDGFQVGIAGHHKPVDVGVNYTLALNKDDDSNDGPEWTYSKQDVRHHFTWSVVTDLGAGFVFSGVLITRSGLGPDTADGPPVSDTGANQFAKPDQT